MATRTFKIWRGNQDGGDFVSYETEITEGMVVLDAIHQIQSESANDMAVRWNCKAGKCGSCGCEINGKPKLSCMTRMNSLPDDGEIMIQPLKTFPVIKDLVSDVSYTYERNKQIPPFKPRPREADGEHRMDQVDIDRVQEFRKCIECFLCQDVCHILRDRETQQNFAGPRFMVRLASLEMHPLDTDDRLQELKDESGSGLCNITRCCTEACPEHIGITDNAIIPMKERVVDRFYDPLVWLMRKLKPGNSREKTTVE